MSNKELIERLKGNDVILVLSIRAQAADALEAANQRIAELEHKIDEAYKKGYATGEEEAERKLAVARAALIQIANAADNQGAFTGMSWHQAKAVCTAALAQIGGDDAGT